MRESCRYIYYYAPHNAMLEFMYGYSVLMQHGVVNLLRYRVGVAITDDDLVYVDYHEADMRRAYKRGTLIELGLL